MHYKALFNYYPVTSHGHINGNLKIELELNRRNQDRKITNTQTVSIF